MSNTFRPPTPDDINIVARTIWGEARGESILGREGVAAVIGNRASIAAAYMDEHGHPHALFGDGSLGAVCGVSWHGTFQFTSWNPDDPNRLHMRTVTTADPAFADCLNIAQTLGRGALTDPTGGATNYLNEAAVIKAEGHLPGWCAAMTKTVVIGNHTFYRG